MANKGLLIFLVLLVTGIITTVVVLMMKKPKSKDCGKFIKNDDGTCSTTACLTGYKLDGTACVALPSEIIADAVVRNDDANTTYYFVGDQFYTMGRRKGSCRAYTYKRYLGRYSVHKYGCCNI